MDSYNLVLILRLEVIRDERIRMAGGEPMLINFFKNHFWIETGIETIMLATYLEYIQREFAPRDSFWISNIVERLDDPYVPLIIAGVGIYAIVVSLWDIKRFDARNIMIGALQFVWTFYTLALVYRDFDFGRTFGLLTGLCAMVVIRIFINGIKQAVLLRLSTYKIQKSLKGERGRT